SRRGDQETEPAPPGAPALGQKKPVAVAAPSPKRGGSGMSRVLITVVGPRRRANLAVPFDCPINDLMSGLVERCGEDTNGHNGDGGGREWAISRSDARLLPPDRSLQDCGITDGAILYLRPASVGDSQPL